MKAMFLGLVAILGFSFSANAESIYDAQQAARNTSSYARNLSQRVNYISVNVDLSAAEQTINSVNSILQVTLDGNKPGGGAYLPPNNSALDPVRNQLRLAIQQLNSALAAQSSAAIRARNELASQTNVLYNESLNTVRSATYTEQVLTRVYCAPQF